MAKQSKIPKDNTFDSMETRRNWATGFSSYGGRRIESKHSKGRTSPIAKKKKKKRK